MRRWGSLFLCVGFGLLAAGCPKGQPDYNQGKKAEAIQDYDAAFVYYQKAAKANPYNASYKIKLNRARFEASEFHVKHGLEMRKQGDLQGAASEFQRAQTIDPASPVADQELRKTIEMIAEKNRAADAAAEPPADSNETPLAAMPPEIKRLSSASISLTMDNDAKIVFETIGKLAGLTVIFDPDFPARRIPAHLNNVTMEQALEIVSLESKAFWKPVTENIILVIPDQPQKRRDYEEQVVKTIYLSNTFQPQDITEIMTGLRQLLDLNALQVQQLAQPGHNFSNILRLKGIRKIDSLDDLFFVVAALLRLVGDHEDDVFRDRLPERFALQRHDFQRLLHRHIVQMRRDAPGREIRVKNHRKPRQFPDRLENDLRVIVHRQTNGSTR